MNDRMRIIITGDRNWYCIKLARQIIFRLGCRYSDFVIVHGACKTGVDKAFDDAALEAHLIPERHPASWETLKLAAGPLRNGEMVKAGAKFAIAVHKNLSWSKGTKDCVKQLRQAKIPVYLIDNDEGKARRI